MRNYADTVAGFNLWLVLNRTDRMVFQTNLDTVIDTTYYKCTSWNGSICLDTVISSYYWVCTQYSGSTCIDSSYHWGIIDVRIIIYRIRSVSIRYGCPGMTGAWSTRLRYTRGISTRPDTNFGMGIYSISFFGGSGYDIKITGQANLAPPPYHKGIGFPQYGTKPLIKLLADIYPLPDSATSGLSESRFGPIIWIISVLSDKMEFDWAYFLLCSRYQLVCLPGLVGRKLPFMEEVFGRRPIPSMSILSWRRSLIPQKSRLRWSVFDIAGVVRRCQQ